MKRNFKKLVSILSVLILIISLTGCGKEKKVETKKEKISVGSWEENTYTNKFLDIKYTNLEGWTYSSKEELASHMNINLETIGDLDDSNNNYIKELEKQVTVYYLSASNPKTGENIQIVSEKMMMDITEDYYMDDLTDKFNNMDAIKYEVLDRTEEKLGNNNYKVLTLKAKDYSIYQKVYIRKKNDYIINVIFTSTKGIDNLTEMANSFE